MQISLPTIVLANLGSQKSFLDVTIWLIDIFMSLNYNGIQIM